MGTGVKESQSKEKVYRLQEKVGEKESNEVWWKRQGDEADNEMRASRGRRVTERQKDVRMRFTVQLLFNL